MIFSEGAESIRGFQSTICCVICQLMERFQHLLSLSYAAVSQLMQIARTGEEKSTCNKDLWLLKEGETYCNGIQ